MKNFEQIKFESYSKSVPELLDALKFSELLKNIKSKKIILKPNLTCNKQFPTTTHPEFVEEILKYIKHKNMENNKNKKNEGTEIIIAEGSGGDPTSVCFEALGYKQLIEKYNVPLVDLNEAPVTRIKSSLFKKFSFVDYPKILLNSFLISLPVLKEHSEADITISLKNMLGCFPARFYGGNWKTTMHKWPIDYSIHDILVCKFPDFALCDASIGQLGQEVSGYPKEFGLLLGGNCLEVDKKACLLLGHDWKKIEHIVFAEELLKIAKT